MSTAWLRPVERAAGGAASMNTSSCAVAGFLKLKRPAEILAFTDAATTAALFGLTPK